MSAAGRAGSPANALSWSVDFLLSSSPSCILTPLLQQLNFLCLHQRRTENGWNTPLVNKTFNQKFSCIKTIRRVSQHRLLRVLQHRRKLSPRGRGAVGAGAPPPRRRAIIPSNFALQFVDLRCCYVPQHVSGAWAATSRSTLCSAPSFFCNARSPLRSTRCSARFAPFSAPLTLRSHSAHMLCYVRIVHKIDQNIVFPDERTPKKFWEGSLSLYPTPFSTPNLKMSYTSAPTQRKSSLAFSRSSQFHSLEPVARLRAVFYLQCIGVTTACTPHNLTLPLPVFTLVQLILLAERGISLWTTWPRLFLSTVQCFVKLKSVSQLFVLNNFI